MKETNVDPELAEPDADDQDIVDEIGREIGLTYEETETLRVGEKEGERDRHRWELDPASADDWRERLQDTGIAQPVLKMKHEHRARRP